VLLSKRKRWDMTTLLNLDEIFGLEPRPATSAVSPVGGTSAIDEPNVATHEELRYWLYLLRAEGATIRLAEGVPEIVWPDHLNSEGRRRDWAVNLSDIAAILHEEALAHSALSERESQGRHLINCGFPPQRTEPPPAAVLATARLICPRCRHGTVLVELRGITGGTCWPCWEREGQKPC
jgi:hypothetical protein